MRERTWDRAAAVGCCAVLAAMMGMTTLTYDDYYYARFWQDGLGNFIQMNIDHFFSRNGRVLVHLAAETSLVWGTWGYALWTIGLLAAVCGLFSRFLGAEKGNVPKFSAAFFLLVLLTGYQVQRSWLLCPADCANYLFPFLLIGWLLACLEGDRPGLTVAAAFLCGATTELCGSMTFVLVGLLGLRRLWKDRKLPRAHIAALAAIAVGLLTVFASPATRQRVGAEFSLADMGEAFLRYANSLAAARTGLWNLAALCLLLGRLGLKNRGERLLALGFPAAGLLATGAVVQWSANWTAVCCGAAMIYLLAAGLVLLKGDGWRTGCLLLAGLASAAVVLVSRSCSIRVTTPLLTMVTLCTARELADIRLPKWVPAAVFCAGVLVQLGPLCGLAENYRVRLENEENLARARQTGTLIYQDYDPDYAQQMLFSDANITRIYLDYHDLETVSVAYTYTRQENAILWQGRRYVPLRAAVEAAGGTVRVVSDGCVEIRLGDAVWLRRGDRLYSREENRSCEGCFLLIDNSTYISEELAEKIINGEA